MGRTGRGCGLQFPVLQYSSRNLCHSINSDKSSYKAITWQLYKHFLGGYKRFSKKNQPLALWAEPTGNTHSWEGEKSLLSLCNHNIPQGFSSERLQQRQQSYSSCQKQLYSVPQIGNVSGFAQHLLLATRLEML